MTPHAMTFAALPSPLNPARQALEPGASGGLLGIELAPRRRNQMNGRVGGGAEGGFTADVDQSFGKCPKYILTRLHLRDRSDQSVVRRVETVWLGHKALALVESADTFFIATASGPDRKDWIGGVDVSHCGRAPGFVRAGEVAGKTMLTVPDFTGIGFFNTLGNLVQEPRAGLLFVNFKCGHLLQLSARSIFHWNSPEAAAALGANRILTL